jgi:hypothetical protein
MELESHLRALEESLLDPEVRRDSGRVDSLLADDFIEFGSSGRVFSKRAIIEELGQEGGSYAATLSNYSLQVLAQDVMLATYRTTSLLQTNKQPRVALRSSIWVHRDCRWQMTFHQGTLVRPL